MLRSSIPTQREVELWFWKLMLSERCRAAADPPERHVMIVVLDGVLSLESGPTTRQLDALSHVFEGIQTYAFVNVRDHPVRFLRCTIFTQRDQGCRTTEAFRVAACPYRGRIFAW